MGYKRYYNRGMVGGYIHWSPIGAYAVVNTLTNLTNTNTAEETEIGVDYVGVLVGVPGYVPPASIVVYIGGEMSSAYDYDSETGQITIYTADITGDINIIASGAVGVFAIINDLTNVVNLNTATEIDGLLDYIATLEAADGYDLPQVISVTIDGHAISRSWNPATGELVIDAADITGDITIIAIGDEREIWDGSIADSYCGGSGTESDPYLICSGGALALLAANVALGEDYSGTYFRQVKNIYLNDTADFGSWDDSTVGLNDWVSIGNISAHQFNGYFDGQQYKIDGAYMVGTADTSVVGLFGYVGADAVIENIVMTNVYASNPATNGNAAGLVFALYGTLRQCTVDGVISANAYAGALARYAENATITGCINYATVDAARCGGIAGRIYADGATLSLSVTECKNYGAITASARGGGIIGETGATSAASSGFLITKCANHTEVTSSTYGGGIVGYMTSVAYATVFNCRNTADIQGTTGAGGICGTTGSVRIINCSNVGDLACGSGSGYAGGIIGESGPNSHVWCCSSAAESITGHVVGGLVGSMYSSAGVSNSFWLYSGSLGVYAGKVGYGDYFSNNARFNGGGNTTEAYQVDGAGTVYPIGTSATTCLNAKAATIEDALEWTGVYPEIQGV